MELAFFPPADLALKTINEPTPSLLAVADHHSFIDCSSVEDGADKAMRSIVLLLADEDGFHAIDSAPCINHCYQGLGHLD